jgi:serine/threonine protein kinase
MQRSWSDEPITRQDSGVAVAPLCGRYEWRRSIGRGGFGLVTLCRDLYTDTYVAVKTICSNTLRTEWPRIVREVEIMSRLSHAHPHVLSLLEYFVTVDPSSENQLASHGWLRYVQPYITVLQQLHNLVLNGISSQTYVERYNELMCELQQSLYSLPSEVYSALRLELHVIMPLMHGDLHKLLRPTLSSAVVPSGVNKLSATTKVITGILAVPFAFQICFAVDFLHKSNIVHRDLKPENILVWMDDEVPLNSSVFVADFGLARDQARSSSTWYICTRFYRPPEVVVKMGTPDSSMDIWAMGCILYELVTQDVLFRLPTSRDANNQWAEMRASRQLDLVTSIVGVPSAEDIDTYGASWGAKVRSHLHRCSSKPSVLAEQIRDRWSLADTSRMELWIDLIVSCLQFFPQQRCTAEEACRHDLFRFDQILYNENVIQHAPHVYVPDVDVMTLSTEECARRLIHNAHQGFAARRNLSVEEATEWRRARSPPLAPLTPDELPPEMGLGLTQVTDEGLRLIFTQLPTSTENEIDAAINTALQLLMDYTHDPFLSAQVNAALRFFVALRDLPKTEVVHGIVDDEEDEGPYCDDLA